MKREPLKVGDRVRVFCTYGFWDGTVDSLEKVTFKVEDGPMEMVRVKNSGGTTTRQHPRQCVRLRRRERSEKRERITAWARKYDDGSLVLVERKPSLSSFMTGTAHRDARLVECAENEVVLSRAELARAWKKDALHLHLPEGNFESLCAALGLEESK